MSRKDMILIVGVLAVAVGVLAIIGPPVALAEPAQQFSLQVRAARSGQVSLRLRGSGLRG